MKAGMISLLLVAASYALLVAFPLPKNGSIGLPQIINAIISGPLYFLYPAFLFVYFLERQKTDSSVLKTAFKVIIYVAVAAITYPTLFLKLILVHTSTISAYDYVLLGFTPIATLVILAEVLRKV
ncbi:hypothetical protein B9Q06_10140 [Candidatus Marsarchaeota G2 archaeon ECH_B_2]|uniref:Uncharacterized protein n=3 Tax=Candidatus Marsarchaeota group 2 TaxID=2203771 RepID=A0A2R6B670_9ARCH|nr:MAG: hypothetical protein B9Q06_10140 [Candidatus Marsarchaeota G2 archaeon ECH_B_2]PSN98677.1 MAG: hypothetical protein B9Q07_09050 [Candidatus Marsarchaeota G2 archaeon ECH_B_3]PSO00538.1 MAG: hypothetical protein B9Q05_10335 [Candidatus Marsarchaeota G2 archaeon ECH_B_1]